MWQPDLKGRGVLVASWVGTGSREVIVVLDPPRAAMPSDAYRAAQRNVSALVRSVPGDKPFVVGLQEEFWRELDRRGVANDGGALPESYLEDGGLGIVDAVAGQRDRARLARLEQSDQVKEYQAAELAAMSAMASVARFLSALASAHREATRASYSEELAEFSDAAAAAWEKPSEAGLIPAMARGSASAGLDLTTPAYRLVSLYMRLRELESRFADDAVELERDRLAEAIRDAGSPERIGRRAAWELYRFTLQKRVPGDEEAERLVAEIDEQLRHDQLPAPPGEAVDLVRGVVEDAAMVGLVRLEHGIDKHDLLGTGEQIAVKLELAAVLGIEPSGYPTLPEYVHYCAVQREMNEISHGQIAAAIRRICVKLDANVKTRLAETDEELALVTLEPTMRFVEALGRFQYVHDEHLRPAVAGFDARTICETVWSAGGSLPDGWEREATRVDEAFGPIRDYFDLTILRGKDLARGLVTEIDERDVARGLLVCDGYLNSYLGRWFEGHDVSYFLCAPTW